MSKILFSPWEYKIHVQATVYWMQKVVNDAIDIFTSEDMENVSGYFLVEHSSI